MECINYLTQFTIEFESMLIYFNYITLNVHLRQLLQNIIIFKLHKIQFTALIHLLLLNTLTIQKEEKEKHQNHQKNSTQ